MISPAVNPDFSNLLSPIDAEVLLKDLQGLENNRIKTPDNRLVIEKSEPLKQLSIQWQRLFTSQARNILVDDSEQAITDWLIRLFNTLFADQQVILVRGDNEPEYFPANNNQPARIEFAHGFFQSALHECSHWCIAGERRRQLSDFGYWYAADGRSEAQQQAFERVEIRPQALECLFTLACRRPFQVSQDNLFADFDTSGSTFAHDVYLQVKEYIAKPCTLPRDAKTLLATLLRVCSID